MAEFVNVGCRHSVNTKSLNILTNSQYQCINKHPKKLIVFVINQKHKKYHQSVGIIFGHITCVSAIKIYLQYSWFIITLTTIALNI